MNKIIGFFAGRGDGAVCVNCFNFKDAKFYNLDEPITSGQWLPEKVDCDKCGKNILRAGD